MFTYSPSIYSARREWLMLLATFLVFFLTLRPVRRSTLFPYTTLFRSIGVYHPLAAIDFDNGRDECDDVIARSEEHTSELQSRFDLVCRLLLEKKNDVNAAYIFIAGIFQTHACAIGLYSDEELLPANES